MSKLKREKQDFKFKDTHILIIEGRFYNHINDMLLKGAIEALKSAKVEYTLVTMPGALEIPQAANYALSINAYDGMIALGCVIRGDTGHYDVVVNESNAALMGLAMISFIPLGNGILTVENEAQAIERADPLQLDKGGDAARACLALIQFQQNFKEIEQE